VAASSPHPTFFIWCCQSFGHPFDARTYRRRNVIERTFSRLKDFRRIATRYDKLASSFLAAVAIACIVSYWL